MCFSRMHITICKHVFGHFEYVCLLWIFRASFLLCLVRFMFRFYFVACLDYIEERFFSPQLIEWIEYRESVKNLVDNETDRVILLLFFLGAHSSVQKWRTSIFIAAILSVWYRLKTNDNFWLFEIDNWRGCRNKTKRENKTAKNSKHFAWRFQVFDSIIGI